MPIDRASDQYWRHAPERQGAVQTHEQAPSKRAPAGFLNLTCLALVVACMFMAYARSGELVTLQVNGDTWRTQTHQRTVGEFLREVGLSIHPADTVSPALDSVLEAGHEIRVQKALPVSVEADGQVSEHYTLSDSVGDLLSEANLNTKSHDVLTLNGKAVDTDTPLPHLEWKPDRWPLMSSLARSLASLGQAVDNSSSDSWLRLRLQRAVPLTINDDGMYNTVYTVARTIGDALLAQNITLYLGDRVQPLLGTLLTTGMHVEIQRAKPVTLRVDGKDIRTRTQARNVAQLLSETGVILRGKDYTLPALDAEITQAASVRVVRVVEDSVIESQEIPFQTVWRADSKLELDQQRTEQPGRAGVRKRNLHIVYEDGTETSREIEDEWVERQPTTRIVCYGTNILVRELQTPDGPIRYWRHVRMLATSYRASDVGKSPDHPTYGITRLGWKATRGIVAVDPTVIALRTSVYVPGYGPGVAADTGGMIKGRWIDLCYDEEDWVAWKSWVDVYLVEPAPPPDQINWLLPNYPTERR